MDNFVVSARKYRPDSFETVVGQPSITRTLKNAVKIGQIAHAYLFCGPRGVGKTTCARIFAKTINCLEPGPDGEACNQCESCRSFSENRSFNIHELDAASNNSVDDIRDLIDQIRIPPQLGKYSIYIIDEVHMLSQAAFNSFLKTLEEPPGHAVFILATTEKHKILPTILSRCQIFDFRRITVRDMMEHLSEVANKEGVTIDDTSLNIIAQKADGSMRDALSVFDQVVSFCGHQVEYKSVIENLNVLDYEYYFRITQSLVEGDYQEVLKIFDEVLDRGFDSRNFLNGLGKHFRNMLMARDAETIQLLELSGEIADKYRDYARKSSVEFLFRALDIIGTADINFRQARDPRLHMEICLLKLSGLTSRIKFDNPSAEPSRKNKAEIIGSEKKVSPEKSISPDKTINPEKTESHENKSSLKADNDIDKEPVEENNEGKTDQTGSKENTEAVSTVTSRESPASRELSAPIKTGPRIRDFMEGNGTGEKEVAIEPEDVENENDEQGDLELTQEILEKLWFSFADKIREDQPRLYNTLSTQKPKLSDGSIIRLDLNNPLQEKALNSIHNEILGFLKKSTGMMDIKLETNVAKASNEKRLYTPEEKFRHLQEQNPQLADLRNAFNLDFE
jgi:DNA polymerase-3 subunit gamma/tau